MHVLMPKRLLVSDLCLLAVITAYIAICPYTKVEESFNIQAVHDMLEHGTDLSAYDHNLFPGVVPRTFVGALGLASAAYPIHAGLRLLEDWLHFPTLFWSQYLCRFLLGLASWLSYKRLRKSICVKFGDDAGFYFGILLCLQFHLPFYCSRSLPNTFALILSMQSYSMWLNGLCHSALYTVAAAAVIFRCDMVLLLGPMALAMLAAAEIPFWRTALSGIAVSGVALAVSVLVDSYFWGRWLYPEGEVLLFNTVENKSSEWGVSPWHWYVSSALPKGLLVSLPLFAAGAVGTRRPAALSPMHHAHKSLLYYSAPAMTFVFIYSFLPHKELRFILPTFPVFTMGAAVTLSWMSPDVDSSPRRHSTELQTCSSVLTRLAAAAVVVSSICLIAFFTTASAHNYPGGVALEHLHTFISTDINRLAQLPQSSICKGRDIRPVNVHLDVLACVSGITKFAELRNLRHYCNSSDSSSKPIPILYSKDETFRAAAELQQFDWVVTSLPMQQPLSDLEFRTEATINSFNRFSLKPHLLKHLSWPIVLDLSPTLVVMKNMKSLSSL